MSINYNEQSKIFTLETHDSSYQMMLNDFNHLLHLYYGKKVYGTMEHLITFKDHGFSGNPYESKMDRTYSLDVLPLEYSTYGIGDYRVNSLCVGNMDGSVCCDLRYKGHIIYKGKYQLNNLPASYDNNGDCTTLEIYLEDEVSSVQVTLLYGVFEQQNVISRSVLVKNQGNTPIKLKKVHSASIDFINGMDDLIHFHGRHCHERNIERVPISSLQHVVESNRGTSSHQQSPFVIVCDNNTNEQVGNCYGFNLVYSGGFQAQVEKDQFGLVRITMGIQEKGFEYTVLPEETFVAPEVILTYSSEGFEKLTHNYHYFIRHNICRGKYALSERPVVINNWEATYFDFSRNCINKIAKEASALGVDMIVLDDGWFGKRDCDNTSLGDWIVNEEKIGGSLRALVDSINKMGLKFGLWIEPEMISEDSNLFRSNPEWALTIPGRKPILSRNQLVLDFSRKDVVDSIFNQICSVIDGVNIEYIKMDMNRSLSDVYSSVVEKERQGEVYHNYVLGVYDFLQRLTSRYPNILIEGCSGGGGRFDLGMLYYSPQIWTSDNTDAIDRLSIQYGTSFAFPLSSMGSHVSAVPNHQSGRYAPFNTRGVVAMAGCFGYELDLCDLTEYEKEMVKQQIIDYKKYSKLIHEGRYYRLTNPIADDVSSWMSVSEDGEEALLSAVFMKKIVNGGPIIIYLRGLQENATYQILNKTYSGSCLMYGGYVLEDPIVEYDSFQIIIQRVAN